MIFKFLMVFLTFLSLSFAQSLRVEIDTFIKNYNSYKIIDARSTDEYKDLHLKNALSFPLTLTFENLSLNGKLVEPNKMQKIIQDLGLNVDDKIIIYDDGKFFDAARVFWSLEVYGFSNVKLLNGGFDKWLSLNKPVTSKVPVVTKSDYAPVINHKRLATKFSTLIATKSPNQTIIDARTAPEYQGKKSSAKRYGHIPKAVHIPAVYNLHNSKDILTLKDTSALKELYKNIDKNKKVVIYCAIGKAAATNYFSLRELGYNVANYDSSWNEWGNDITLPIVNPSKE